VRSALPHAADVLARKPLSTLFSSCIACCEHSTVFGQCAWLRQTATTGKASPQFYDVPAPMQEVQGALNWLAINLDPEHPAKFDNSCVSHFETTIRVLGGFLSAFHLLDGDQRMLALAIDVGLRLLAAFTTNDGLPHNVVCFDNLTSQDAAWTQEVSLSEATTLSLEFGYLARVRIHHATTHKGA
jgi:Glycosyl hydrolase family 47